MRVRAIGLCFGLRISEILGLRWTDFDFKRSVVLIQRSAVGKRLNKLKTDLGGRSSDRKGLHSGTKEMAIDLSRFEGAMALPEPDDRSSVSRRFDSRRLPCSNGSSIGTRQDRVPYVSSHVSCLAGRNRSTGGRAAETDATCAHFYNDGPVWKCLGYGEAQGQSANCATAVEKVCQSAADRDSINKGNCEAVPLIGQFWTVTTLQQLPVTL